MGVLEELARSMLARPAPRRGTAFKSLDHPNRDPEGRVRGPGRPRGAGLAKQIREATGEGTELVEFYLRVSRGEEPDHRLVQRSDGSPSIEEVPASLKDRMAASEWLAARGFGKVPDQVIIEATKVDATSGQTTHSDRQWEGRQVRTKAAKCTSMAALVGSSAVSVSQNWLSGRSVACALGAV